MQLLKCGVERGVPLGPTRSGKLIVRTFTFRICVVKPSRTTHTAWYSVTWTTITVTVHWLVYLTTNWEGKGYFLDSRTPQTHTQTSLNLLRRDWIFEISRGSWRCSIQKVTSENLLSSLSSRMWDTGKKWHPGESDDVKTTANTDGPSEIWHNTPIRLSNISCTDWWVKCWADHETCSIRSGRQSSQLAIK